MIPSVVHLSNKTLLHSQLVLSICGVGGYNAYVGTKITMYFIVYATMCSTLCCHGSWLSIY